MFGTRNGQPASGPIIRFRRTFGRHTWAGPPKTVPATAHAHDNRHSLLTVTQPHRRRRVTTSVGLARSKRRPPQPVGWIIGYGRIVRRNIHRLRLTSPDRQFLPAGVHQRQRTMPIPAASGSFASNSFICPAGTHRRGFAFADQCHLIDEGGKASVQIQGTPQSKIPSRI